MHKYTIILYLLLFASDVILANDRIDQMSLDEKVGQLFIAGVYSNKEDAEKEGLLEDPIAYIEKMIEKYHIGGVLFKMRWSPLEVHHFCSYFQSLSKRPLFTAIDAEWGLAMRMESAPTFPKNQALGEHVEDSLIYLLGKEIGRELRYIGINWNFSPVADIYSQPNNPIIHDRSFGEDRELVAKRVSQMVKGLEDSGVMATVKHFPGHGSATIDSHAGLPVISQTKEKLIANELYPFRVAIDQHVSSIMTAHLLIPALDSEYPTSLSQKTVEDLLKGEMGYEGLVITDDLLMDAVSKKYSPGERACLAFLAGNDIILSSRDIEESIRALKEAVLMGRIPEHEIDKRIAKIMKAKKWIAETGNPTPSVFREEQLFTEDTLILQKKLFRQAVHVLPDRDPFLSLNGKTHLCLVEVNAKTTGPLYQELVLRKGADYRYLSKHPSDRELDLFYQTLNKEAAVIIALKGMNRTFNDGFGISDEIYRMIDELAHQNSQVIVVIFGNPSVAAKMPRKAHVIAAYEDLPEVQRIVLQLLYPSPQR